MEVLAEIVVELFLEGIMELGHNERVPKWIRYPAAVLTVLLITTVIGAVFLCAFLLRDTLPLSLLFLAAGIALLAGCAVKFRKYYQIKQSTRKLKGDKPYGNDPEY